MNQNNNITVSARPDYQKEFSWNGKTSIMHYPAAVAFVPYELMNSFVDFLHEEVKKQKDQFREFQDVEEIKTEILGDPFSYRIRNGISNDNKETFKHGKVVLLVSRFYNSIKDGENMEKLAKLCAGIMNRAGVKCQELVAM